MYVCVCVCVGVGVRVCVFVYVCMYDMCVTSVMFFCQMNLIFVYFYFEELRIKS